MRYTSQTALLAALLLCAFSLGSSARTYGSTGLTTVAASSSAAGAVRSFDPADFCPNKDCEVNCEYFTNGVFDTAAPPGSLSSSVLLAALAYYSYPENLLGPSVEALIGVKATAATFDEQFTALFTQMGLTSYRFLDVESPKGYVTQGVVTASANDIVLVFKGTSSVKDLIPDMTTGCTNTLEFGHKACVHKGFLDSWRSSRGAVMNAIIQVVPDPALRRRSLQQVAPSSPRIWLTGHSLGAALATLFAADLANQGFVVSGVTTFGSPKIGDYNFVQAYRQLGLADITSRWVHENDIVTQLPLDVMGYRHVGRRYVLHAGRCDYDPVEECVEASFIPGFCKQSTADHFMEGYAESIKACLRKAETLAACAIDNLPL